MIIIIMIIIIMMIIIMIIIIMIMPSQMGLLETITRNDHISQTASTPRAKNKRNNKENRKQHKYKGNTYSSIFRCIIVG